jgi:hypothetical protein
MSGSSTARLLTVMDGKRATSNDSSPSESTATPSREYSAKPIGENDPQFGFDEIIQQMLSNDIPSNGI